MALGTDCQGGTPAAHARHSVPGRTEEAVEAADLVRFNRIGTIEAFGTTIAHELVQPIASARLLADAARRWADQAHLDWDEVRSALGILSAELNRAHQIATSVRRLASPDHGSPQVVTPEELVDRLSALLRANAKARAVELSVTVFGDAGRYTVLSQGEQISQVLLNLVNNAIEAFPQAGDQPGAPRTINVMLAVSAARWVEIRVQDNGSGMTPDTLERIFDPFYTTKPDGVGLGLAICDKIAREHGGALEFTSSLGVGTCAVLCLPVHGRVERRARTRPSRSRIAAAG